MTKVEEKIIDVIDKIRPYLVSDGGNIEFVKYEDGIVYVRLSGACTHCEMFQLTLKSGIEGTLKEEIPEVKEVVNVE